MKMFPLHLVETCDLYFELMSAFSHYPVTIKIANHSNTVTFMVSAQNSNLLKKLKSYFIKHVQLPNKIFVLR